MFTNTLACSHTAAMNLATMSEFLGQIFHGQLHSYRESDCVGHRLSGLWASIVNHATVASVTYSDNYIIKTGS